MSKCLFKLDKLIAIILSFLILSTNLFLLSVHPVFAATPTDFVKDVQPGFYLRYEEEISLTCKSWDWNNKKVGAAIRKITIVEVGEESFTVREDITYKMNLENNLDYFYVDLETLDGEREELEGGSSSSNPGNDVLTFISAYYRVDLDSGEVLEYLQGRVNSQKETDQTDQIPQEIEHYWSYVNTDDNSQEYLWDVVGFPYLDTRWGYSVQPNMEKGKKFENNKWTVKDPISKKFDGQAQESMNITGNWKDETDQETLAEWQSQKYCDKDTGIKLAQTWNGDCKIQIYDLATLEWSLKDDFQIEVIQELTHTNFQLHLSEHPDSTIRILSPNQGALVGEKIIIKTQIDNDLHDTTINQINYYAKASSSESWTLLDRQSVIEAWVEEKFVAEKEVDVSTWAGKWQIKVEGSSILDETQRNEYFDIVDVFLKPVYIDTLDVTLLEQSTLGPHIDGGLDRIPYEVSFNVHAREDIIGDPQILIDCWYLPLTGNFWSEELGETVNLENYWGGDPAYQSLFKALYETEYSGNDPIIGSHTLTAKQIVDDPKLTYVDGGSYQNQDITYALLDKNGNSQSTSSLKNNKSTTLSIKKGETASFDFRLYFNNPGSQNNPKIRLFSLEVLIDYQASVEDEEQEITEYAQKTIAVKRIEPTITPYDAFIDQISQTFSPNNMLGYAIEQTFGEEYAQAAYEGNYIQYLYYLAMGIDFTIRSTPTALSYFGIITGPYWAAVVGTVSIITGVPLPTSWLDLVTEISARAYASVPQEDRIGIWYVLLQAAAGVEESTKVFDPKPLVDWANILSVSGEGELLTTTLSIKVRTYEKEDNQYYLDYNLTNIGDFPARFLTICVRGDPAHPLTRHEFEQIDLDPGEKIVPDKHVYVGNKYGSYRFDIYFISKPSSTSTPVYSLNKGNGVWVPKQEFELPIISEMITAFSPVNIQVIDPNGSKVGSDSSENVFLQIPGCWYSGSKDSPESIVLCQDNLQTKLEIFGTETGTYKLNFQKPLLLTDSKGEKTLVMSSFTLSNVKISKGEKHAYTYNFTKIEDQINQLTIRGWSSKEAINYIFSNIDTDHDGIPDAIDENPLEQTSSFDITTIAIILGVVVAIVAAFLYFRKPKKANYKKLDEF